MSRARISSASPRLLRALSIQLLNRSPSVEQRVENIAEKAQGLFATLPKEKFALYTKHVYKAASLLRSPSRVSRSSTLWCSWALSTWCLLTKSLSVPYRNSSHREAWKPHDESWEGHPWLPTRPSHYVWKLLAFQELLVIEEMDIDCIFCAFNVIWTPFNKESVPKRS